MKVYKAIITEYIEHEIVIEAIDEDEAKEMAEEIFIREHEPTESWAVSEVEEWS